MRVPSSTVPYSSPGWVCRPVETLDRAADPAASTEGPLFVQQVYDLCNDEDIQLLLMAQADRATPEEIKADCRWDDKKYETVQKRKRRLVIRLMREGKLP